MQLFNRIFGAGTADEHEPDIHFGRYSDAYKTPSQYDAWDKALVHFERKEYLKSFKVFLEYLRDEKQNNIHWTESKGQLTFEILQGSKKITGLANAQRIRVETKLARADYLNISFMRRLMELNFKLEYGRYALDEEQDIAMVFDTYTLDGSPYKLYYALKEMATKADKLDDLLIDEFQMLHPTDTGLQQPIPEAEKIIKYNFIKQQIEAIFEQIDQGPLNAGQYPGAVGYLLLDLCYKLDYLIQPEGFMMECLERIHRLYFAKDNSEMIHKIKVLRKEFQNLAKRSRAEFFKEMYRVNSTFGITIPVNHQRIRNFIDVEIKNMSWYEERGYRKYALAIPGFIIGYCMFYYAPPRPVRAYFELYYRITESSYFYQLGFKPVYYDEKTDTLQKKLIKRKIKAIAGSLRESYPRLNPGVHLLNFDSLVTFTRSYLQMIYELDTSKS